MSITDELREWMGAVLTDDDPAHAIADRIDEAHKHAIAYVDDRNQETMAEHGWVKFPPLDADGEPWHIGDEIANQYDLHLTVSEIVYASNGYWMIHAKPNWRFYANLANHYRPPTVEDILREFALRAIRESEGNYGDLDETCAEYAKRLRLAGDAE